PPILDEHILAFHIPESAQTLAKRLPFRAVGGAENTDPPYLLRLLRPSGDRRDEEAACEGRHELPASKQIAERSSPDRVGHRPSMENARMAGSLADTQKAQVPKVDGQRLSRPGVRASPN